MSDIELQHLLNRAIDGVVLHGESDRLRELVRQLEERAEQAAAAGLREADWIVQHCPDHGCVEPETDVCHCEIADRLRLMADEPQQPTTTA